MERHPKSLDAATSWQSKMYHDQYQRLKETRYSFITTPRRAGKMYVRIAHHLAESSRPITFWKVLKAFWYLAFYISVTLASLTVPYGIGYGFAVLADLSANDWQLRRPKQDLVVAFAVMIGMIHVFTVMALSTFLYEDLPLSYTMRLIVGMTFVFVLVLIVMGGAVMAVALWKMLRITSSLLHWDVRARDKAIPTAEED